MSAPTIARAAVGLRENGRDTVVPGRCEDCGTSVLTMLCLDEAGVVRTLCGWCRPERRDAGSAVAR